MRKFTCALLLASLAGAPVLAQPQPGPMGVPMFNPARLQAELRASAGSDTVYFSPQGHGLTAATIASLAAQARWLRANPAIMIRLDGHADQGDTRDYAFAIAERRAASVRDFLVAQGVSPDRISLASWGKERPGTIRVGTSMVGVGARVATTIR